MRIDIYRRAEHNGVFSYLAVPEGKTIPDEATNTDWLPEQQAYDLGESTADLTKYHIEHPLEQISAKGYAITGFKDMEQDGHVHS